MELRFSPNELPTPCYIVDEEKLERNLRILKSVSEKTGCKILLAQKAFSMFSLYPLIGKFLDGTAASGLFEARLGYEHMGKENHVYSPAFREEEFGEILSLCDHIVFNSFAQLQKFKGRALSAGRECGLRVNPECSTQDHAIYDPCAPFSRLGVPARDFDPDALDGVSGLHFHTLCEQDFGALEQTMRAVEAQFGKYLRGMKWLNFGGGHHITREDYDVKALIGLIDRTQA
jgi:carboxynorspermidine decarboxylase